MKKLKTIVLAQLAAFALLSMISCQALVQSMWIPNEPCTYEDKCEVRATLVYQGCGLAYITTHPPCTSVLCKFRSDSGKTYRADMIPLMIAYPPNEMGITIGGGLSYPLPFREGQQGVLTVDRKTGYVFSFIPDEHAERVAKNKKDWENYHRLQERKRARE